MPFTRPLKNGSWRYSAVLTVKLKLMSVLQINYCLSEQLPQSTFSLAVQTLEVSSQEQLALVHPQQALVYQELDLFFSNPYSYESSGHPVPSVNLYTTYVDE